MEVDEIEGKVKVEIEGTSPLLMNKFHVEDIEQSGKIEKGVCHRGRKPLTSSTA